MDFQRNNTKRKERMKNRETELSGRWAQHRLWYPGGKIGESIVPWDSRITLQKGGRDCKEGREDWTKESLRKFCREENSEKSVNYFPVS